MTYPGMTTEQLKEYWQHLEDERLELVFTKDRIKRLLCETGIKQICRIQLDINQEIKRRNNNG